MSKQQLQHPVKATQVTVPVVIHFTDGVNDQEAFYLKVLKTDLDDETLSDLRARIAGLSASIEVSHFPFCTKKGAVVPDTFVIQDYLKDCLGVKVSDATTLDIYMKSEKLVTPKSALESLIASYVLDSDALARLKQNVNETTSNVSSGTDSKYIPELEEQDWSVVNESNSLCYGIRVLRSKKGNVAVGVEQARYPAFRLKKRTILSDTLTNTSLQDVNMELRIPEYKIDDKSYITIYETESAAQLAMATSAFAQTDVEAAGSGSFWGCNIAAKASYGQTVSSSDATSTSKSGKQVTIAYNFPRATVFLDERTLELTSQCQDAISKIVDGPTLTNFLEDYGEFFSRRVQVGGRLFATEDVTTAESGSSQETASSMKAAASASFSGWGAEASVSASHEKNASGSITSSTSKSTKTLSWQANGGDTLLANNPQEWAPTVAHHWNWRITQQDNVCLLIELINKFAGQSGIAKRLASYEPATSLGVSPGKHKRFTLSADGVVNGRYLVVFKAATKDLTYTANVLNSAQKGSIVTEPCLSNRGCVLLGPKVATRAPTELALQAETTNHTPATTLNYGTKYYVKHVGTGLWLDFHDGDGPGRPLFAGPKTETTFKFIDPDNISNTGVVNSGGKVKIEFHWKTKSVYAYNAVEDAERDDAIVCATGDNDQSKSAVIMNVRY
ncbi:hypothetical protein QQS21_003844 [Conoideocrella luteorostrata]|uniref:MACPF-like domain-containing protein n=1 Tax=Conoideocrella luteorostrata TaxID=1105319 RepID=A0AAJ0CSK6_9HYPO|nr:hypothetical protein QQS21_003844 [Conoideocrella luteorostrata]